MNPMQKGQIVKCMKNSSTSFWKSPLSTLTSCFAQFIGEALNSFNFSTCCSSSNSNSNSIISGSSRRRTLAIGDGGNDVAMLHEADVGVGISGREGLQAVRAADYGIAEFKFLKRLVLVHGVNSHLRMTKMIHYVLYKAWLISINQLLFALFSYFSGAPVLDSYVLTTYNTVFTLALPVRVNV